MSRIVLLALIACVTAPLCSCGNSSSPNEAASPISVKLPRPGQNNVWYEYNDSDTVIVFVHGILGDSRDTWLYLEKSNSHGQYWPELVLNDESLGKPSIFLGGYYTAVDSRQYDVRDSARELWGALNRKLEFRGAWTNQTVLDKRNIVFVCHSTGGIVARYLVHQHREAFRDKVVGLVLIASPSYGSKTANTLGMISELYQQRQARQLEWANPFLEELDKNFKDLIYNRSISSLVGVEALENHFIVHRKWLPDRFFLVDASSGGRYFGSPVTLRNTDHFSTVKPPDRHHPGHELLADFINGTLRNTVMSNAEKRVLDLQREVLRVRGLFESIPDYPIAAPTEVRAVASQHGSELVAIPDEYLSLRVRIIKNVYAAYAYTMAARVESAPSRRTEFASRALEPAARAIVLMNDAQQRAVKGDADGRVVWDWVRERRAREFTNFEIAVAHAVRARAGGPSTLADVKTALQEIDPKYLVDYPITPKSDLGWAIRQKTLVGDLK